MLLFFRQMFLMCVRARTRVCVYMCVVHWHCTAQLSMFNMEKRFRNKIIIIIIIDMYRKMNTEIMQVKENLQEHPCIFPHYTSLPPSQHRKNIRCEKHKNSNHFDDRSFLYFFT